MSKLFVANATQQINMFAFWMPEQSRPFYVEIPMGGQAQVPTRGSDLPREVIDGIIAQHERYGIMTVVDALKSREFSGIVYSVDKPVRLTDLQMLVDKFRGLLHDRGRELRNQAAIATDQAIQDAMYRDQVPGRLENLEMSVEEISRDQRDETQEVSEGVRVNRHANPDGSLSKRAPSRRPLRRRRGVSA